MNPEEIQDWIDSADWTYERRPCPKCDREAGFYGLRRWCNSCRAKCGHDELVFGRIIATNGAHQYRSLCFICGEMKDQPKTAPSGAWIFKDAREQGRGSEPCARCGSYDGSELHHWAPSAIFWDSGSWPTSYLCRECHRTWHKYMRKAKGYRLDGDERHGIEAKRAREAKWRKRVGELDRVSLIEKLRRGSA